MFLALGILTTEGEKITIKNRLLLVLTFWAYRIYGLKQHMSTSVWIVGERRDPTYSLTPLSVSIHFVPVSYYSIIRPLNKSTSHLYRT